MLTLNPFPIVPRRAAPHTLILRCRGHRYKSRQRSKRSWMKRLYAGTARRLGYFRGRKLSFLSPGSCCAHAKRWGDGETGEQGNRKHSWDPDLPRYRAHLLLARQVLRRRVVGLLVARQSQLGCRHVHLVTPQHGVGVLLGPQVIEVGGGILGPTRLDPAHLDGVHHARHLHTQPRSGSSTGHCPGGQGSVPTFSFSTRDGMKLRLSAGRLVTGWIMRSPLKKSTAGWGDRHYAEALPRPLIPRAN